MAKIGRPPSDNKKEHTVSLRLNEDEYIELREYSAEHKMTITQALQKAIQLLYKKK